MLCGDFNLEPQSGVYKFITGGSFKYAGKGRQLDDISNNILNNSLIPSCLGVTDNCEHFNILKNRLCNDKNQSKDNYCQGKKSTVDPNTTDYQKIKIIKGKYAKFGSGTLSHSHKLSSVYKHKNDNGEFEATTNQDKWITVDYIFHSQLEIIDQYTLPIVRECEQLPVIPNFIVGSDHLSLGATFKIKKNQQLSDKKKYISL